MSRALTVQKVDGAPGAVYYPLKLTEIPRPSPGKNEVLVKIHAAALNHRDFFVRQHLYPGVSFDNPLLADGYGTVVGAGPGVNQSIVGKAVILTPMRGWTSDPEAPEDNSKWTTIGGSNMTPAGTAQDYIVVPETEVELAPEHLTAAEAAALPLVGLTGYRALVTKSGNAKPGRNILLTGIGGGVALQTLQFAVAIGCNVWVTSGSDAKIQAAQKMGAKGGVSYKEKDWDKKLLGLLPPDRPYIDAIIDGTGGDIVRKSIKLVRSGGAIVVYGMTISPKMDWLMSATLKNIELRGTTMGSRREFKEMVEFVRVNKIRPVVSRVVKGLDNLDGINELFDFMKQGKQFGKLVIDISSTGAEGSKL